MNVGERSWPRESQTLRLLLIVLFPASWLLGGCPANPGDSFFNLLHSRSHENAKSAHLHDPSEVKARSNRIEDPDR